MRRKTLAAVTLASVLSITIALSACAPAAEPAAPPQAPAQGAAQTTVAATSNANDAYDFSYSNRDGDATYDAAAATTISFANASASVSGAGAAAEGATVTISAAGTYVCSGSSSSGSIIVNVPGDEDKVQLVLSGLSLTNTAGPAILVEQADKVFVTLAEGTENSLSDGSGRTDSALASAESEDASEHDHNATLFSHDDLTINGTGSLEVESASAHGIFSKDDLVIACGSISELAGQTTLSSSVDEDAAAASAATAAAASAAGSITVSAAGDGIKGKDSVKIAAGNIKVEAGDDGIASTQDGSPYEKGFVSIDGGSLNISAKDDGIHAETVARVAGGSITITQSYEGIEGAQVWMLGGDVQVKSSDDGINAAGSARSDYLLAVNGGSLYVDAEGDGIDSNSAITQAAGDIVVAGPTRSGNGAMDAERTATTSGGTLLAVDSSGMGMTYGSASTQPALLYTPGQTISAGTEVKLLDASGKELFTYKAAKQFTVLAFSSPELVVGNEYRFVANGTELTKFTLSSQVSSISADGTASEYTGQGMMGGRGNMGAAPGGGAGGRGARQ